MTDPIKSFIEAERFDVNSSFKIKDGYPSVRCSQNVGYIVVTIAETVLSW